MVEGMPNVFTGGWVGYCGYDTVRYVYSSEHLPLFLHMSCFLRPLQLNCMYTSDAGQVCCICIHTQPMKSHAACRQAAIQPGA